MKTVLITGCSSGIGEAAAKYFAAKDWNVIATMRNPASGAALAATAHVKVKALDVTDKASIEAAVHGENIDVLINNAGYGVFGPFETASQEVIEKQFSTNVYGVFNVTRAVLPGMRERKSGVIVNVSSVGGLTTFPLFSLYHATKFALFGFSESLQYELAPFGIQVKVIAPGGVKTDFAGRSLGLTYEGSEHPYAAQVAKVMAAFAERRDNYSTTEFLAESIYNAATDGTSRLKYVVGPDAEAFLETRAKLGDDAFFAMLAQRMLA
jgi:NAD(P)-dependent dehydrogenase (short-subunit alcohol dehydrogenase family)